MNYNLITGNLSSLTLQNGLIHDQHYFRKHQLSKNAAVTECHRVQGNFTVIVHIPEDDNSLMR